MPVSKPAFFKPLLALALTAAALALPGCTYTIVADYPYYDETAYAEAAPRTLAIAPIANHSNVEDAGRTMRVNLYGALAPLGYDDLELDATDIVLAHKADLLDVPMDNIHPYYIAQPDLADAVVLGQVEKVSRLFFVLFSQVKVEVRVMLVDTRTRRKLYQNHFLVKNIQINAPTDIIGALTGFFSSLWHMRPEQIEAILAQSAAEIAARFPEPDFGAATGTTFINEVEIGVPRPTLRAGDRIVLRVRGAPGRVTTFSLGDLVDARPMTETAPGQYSGFHEVRDTDNADYLFATIRMVNPEDAAEYVIVEAHDQAFAIDTIPPVPHEVESWQQVPGTAGITLRFRPANRAKPERSQVPSRFAVFRGEGRGATLTFIGSSETPVFNDTTAQPGVEYEYAVIVEDEAGNRGEARSRLLVTPRAPGRAAPAGAADPPAPR